VQVQEQPKPIKVARRGGKQATKLAISDISNSANYTQTHPRMGQAHFFEEG
jgi:hypothetical protein